MIVFGFDKKDRAKGNHGTYAKQYQQYNENNTKHYSLSYMNNNNNNNISIPIARAKIATGSKLTIRENGHNVPIIAIPKTAITETSTNMHGQLIIEEYHNNIQQK